ncbi:uncharacterized protein MYCFIDRAFT_78089, partial [Pseudocercospora fijiensis CIRAD86]
RAADGESIPSLAQEDVLFVPLSHALQPRTRATALPSSTVRPHADTLACIFFTSGSTGMPKGVQIEHRGIVRLATQFECPGRTAHLTSLAFDVSLWEVTGALLTGGSVVCIDQPTVLDPECLRRVLQTHHIQTVMLTPALLKQCLHYMPAAMDGLERVYITGDRLDAVDAVKLKAVSSARAFNAYGPTENSIESTVYELQANEDYANGVPIGMPVNHSGACVVDQQLRVVPKGILGELVLTGDGLARGYTDPTQDEGRFVRLTVGSRQVRAYRTGDAARARPSDGMLECFGRLDRQIKIRGHRIELPEVELTILEHKMVDDAAVVTVQRSRGGEVQPYLLIIDY